MQSIADILDQTAQRQPDAQALVCGSQRLSYASFSDQVGRLAGSLPALGLQPQDRVAVYLDKSIEGVCAIFAAVAAGMIVVPINPKLKAAQVQHVLRDSGATVLVTTPYRRAQLGVLPPGVRTVRVGAVPMGLEPSDAIDLAELLRGPVAQERPRVVDLDPAAILYTSGSTGQPKGVVLSHRNLVEGARSVNAYLGTGAGDVILSLLPLSFDAGLSQLSTGTAAGARIVLHDLLQASEVPPLCETEGVSAITGVPPLWHQLAAAAWPEGARQALRLFASTGGAMPAPLLARLRALFPRAKPFLMYGLTEAFRSTYLDPSQAEQRPGSIGKAIPNNQILVLREDGTPCAPGEVGELVHRGANVTLGYWNDPERTAQRFRVLPRALARGLLPEYGVWSGDFVKTDEAGFIYFIERRDEMLKTSGYRVSPTEIESLLIAQAGVAEVAAIGVRGGNGDQELVAVVVGGASGCDLDALARHCREQLPRYMVPRLVRADALPRNPNGKIDRKLLAALCWDPAVTRLSAAEVDEPAETAAV